MSIKRRAAILLAAVSVSLCLLTSAAAADQLMYITVEQCSVNMPDVNAFVYIESSDGSASPDVEDVTGVTATLGGDLLTFDSATVSTRPISYYFIVDISGSMSGALVSNFKTALIDWLGRMNDTDKFILITMGETAKVVLHGGESRDAAAAEIASINASDRYTVFNESVLLAIDLAEAAGSDETRKIAVVLTDGVDVNSQAGGVTTAELAATLGEAQLPLYALGAGSNRDALAALGELARGSGGMFVNTDKKSVESDVATLQTRMGKCILLQFHAANNIISGENEALALTVTFADGSRITASSSVAVTSWIPDTEPPTATATVEAQNAAVIVSFSEPVTGADIADNYVLFDESGSSVAIASAIYDSAQHTARIIPATAFYDGVYSLGISRISDISMEANTAVFADGSATLSGIEASGGISPEPEKAGLDTWMLIAIFTGVIIIIIVVVMLAVSRKNKEKQEQIEEEQNEQIRQQNKLLDDRINIPQSHGKEVTFNIAEKSGIHRTVTLFIATSIIIGRSAELAQLSISDKRLSRQHCAISFENGALTVTDLNSTNGTFVNGSRLMSVRPLLKGDKIQIGDTNISIMF